MRSRASLLLLSAIELSCAGLPTIEPGVCGNGVVEASEDCDTFAPNPGSICRPKGTIGECHLDCRLQSDGTRPQCPKAWGCSSEGICRTPTGNFEPAVDYANKGAWALLSEDFDGDGRDDIIGLEPPDSIGRTRIRYHYFDEQGILDSSIDFPKLIFPPTAADLNRDGRSDLVFSNFRISTLLGRADRALVPETYGSYHFVDTQLRMVPVYRDAIQNSISAIALLAQNGIPGYYNVDPNSNVLRLQGQLPAPIEYLAGEPASGDIIEDPQASPCREVVLAYWAESQFSLADLCTRQGNAVVWRNQAILKSIALDPAASIDSSVLIVDVNGDGHLDVLIGASGITYVAYGDGINLATATPYRLNLADDSGGALELPIPMPLAAGHISADGAIDFVFSDHLLVSAPSSVGTVPSYTVPYVNFGAPWTIAKIADINGNSRPDVVAASDNGINIDFLNGNGTEFLTGLKVSTDAPVKHLAIGDFDGDLMNDVAFTELDSDDSAKDAVKIAFGVYYEPPLAAVQVARVNAGAQLVATGNLSVDDLLIISGQVADGHTVGDLALLFGGDRLPYAPLQLSSFASDGSVAATAAFSMAVGAFSAPGQTSAMALATPDIDAEHLDWRFWLVPSLTGSNDPPKRLPNSLDTRLTPSHILGYEAAVNIKSTSGDFDGDGLDEAVWAIPADGDTHCGLVFFGQTSHGLDVKDTVFLGEPCIRAQIIALDADADGNIDIALLTGSANFPAHRLLVLWNGGHAEFSDSNSSVISGNDSPEQFAFLAGTPERAFGFAYVTDTVAVFVTAPGNPRNFTRRRVLSTLSRGTGIAAADVNGDGVTDLVLAASGTLRVLKAQLNRP